MNKVKLGPLALNTEVTHVRTTPCRTADGVLHKGNGRYYAYICADVGWEGRGDTEAEVQAAADAALAALVAEIRGPGITEEQREALLDGATELERWAEYQGATERPLVEQQARVLRQMAGGEGL